MQLAQEELRNLALCAQTTFKETGSFPKPEMEKLWKAFLPYINKISFKKSYKSSLNKEDLIQVSYEALVCAVRKFDPSKNDNFFIYASNWIVAYIKAENKRNLSIFKMGTRKDRTMFQKISSVSHLEFDKQAEFLGVSEKELAAFVKAIKPPKGILKRGDENEESGEEYLDSNIPDPEKLLFLKEIYSSIKEVFDAFLREEVLSERDKEIVNLLCRVGSPDKGNFKKDETDTEPQTYADIADKYGTSRQAVQIAANKLKDKLRYKFKKNGIDDKAYHAFL